MQHHFFRGKLAFELINDGSFPFSTELLSLYALLKTLKCKCQLIYVSGKNQFTTGKFTAMKSPRGKVQDEELMVVNVTGSLDIHHMFMNKFSRYHYGYTIIVKDFYLSSSERCLSAIDSFSLWCFLRTVFTQRCLNWYHFWQNTSHSLISYPNWCLSPDRGILLFDKSLIGFLLKRFTLFCQSIRFRMIDIQFIQTVGYP